jgi:hypothetical protein
MTAPAPQFEHHDRDWWRQEAIRTQVDWSSLLRQRIKVLAWVRAGRPPLAQWIASQQQQQDFRDEF